MTSRHFSHLSIYRLLNAVLILVLAGFSWNRSQDEPEGLLKILIVEEETGNPVPARLEVLDDAGQAQIAGDALLVGSQHPGTYTKVTTKNENSGKELFLQREGWNLEFIGTLEEYRTGLNRTAGRDGEFANQFYSQGTSTLSVKPGRYRIRVLKGFEYSVAKQEVTIRSSETTETTVRLKRWINMSDKGWYSADAHIHIGRQFKELDGALCQWMQAEDVQVSNMLQAGNYRFSRGVPQHTFGRDGVFRDEGYIIASGQEYPRSHFLGHWIILGSDAFIPGGEYYLGLSDFFEEAKRRGGLSGVAHFGTSRGAANGISLVLNQHHLDFIEILQVHGGFYSVWYQTWYDILNMGFRITPTAGSDYSWGKEENFPGRERFYTRVEGPLTYDAWMKSVQQ